MTKKNLTYGVVLSGGGARGAYEAGVMHYIRSALPASARERALHIYSGSSVGGLNACFLAAYADRPLEQGTYLRKAWDQVRQEQIYRRDLAAIGRLMTRSVAGITLNMFRRAKLDEENSSIHFRGLVDTSPFPKFLQRTVAWKRMHEMIERKIVHGVSITLTNMKNSRMEFFIHKHPTVPYTGNYFVRYGELDWRHVMAGAAIPVIFPPVEIDGIYYADGGLRQNTPMSPAIHMGADRVLVIGMHDPKLTSLTANPHGIEVPRPKKKVGTLTPPALGEIFGTILSSIFLDRLDYDLKQMERINRVIDWAEKVYGGDFLDRINQWLKKEGIEGDVASRGLKRLKVCAISPSRDICELFGSVMRRPGVVRSFSAFEKMLFKILDIDLYRGQEFLTYFMFLPEYLRELIQLGFDDAKSRHDELVEFLTE